jgi:hypothetical protein
MMTGFSFQIPVKLLPPPTVLSHPHSGLSFHCPNLSVLSKIIILTPFLIAQQQANFILRHIDSSSLSILCVMLQHSNPDQVVVILLFTQMVTSDRAPW